MTRNWDGSGPLQGGVRSRLRSSPYSGAVDDVEAVSAGKYKLTLKRAGACLVGCRVADICDAMTLTEDEETTHSPDPPNARGIRRLPITDVNAWRDDLDVDVHPTSRPGGVACSVSERDRAEADGLDGHNSRYRSQAPHRAGYPGAGQPIRLPLTESARRREGREN
jgi:hypothetical protein